MGSVWLVGERVRRAHKAKIKSRAWPASLAVTCFPGKQMLAFCKGKFAFGESV